jgi:hypothetical protein
MVAWASRGAALRGRTSGQLGVSGVGLVDHQLIAENGANRYSFQMTSTALAAGQENAEAPKLAPSLGKCASSGPAMSVIPAGRLSMGSPEEDPDSGSRKEPGHRDGKLNRFATGRVEEPRASRTCAAAIALAHL